MVTSSLQGDEVSANQLPTRIEESFAARFGFQSKVILRTAIELERVIAHNPFESQAASTPNLVIALLLVNQPSDAALVDLRQAYSGPEEYQLVERTLYIYYPNGIGRSKLTLPRIEKGLNVVGTGRNWNTVLQLWRLL